MRWLLLAVPVAVGLRVAQAPGLWQFFAACVAIIPLASLMGESTECLSTRLGPGIGGLLNATFGNAAELIIALFALFNGLDEVVKASITGSIMGNLLLVLGVSMLSGGARYSVQHFNRTAAGVGMTMTYVAAVGMLVPAIFDWLVSERVAAGRELAASLANLDHKVSLAVSIVLIVTYFLNLVFSLVTHRDLYNPSFDADRRDVEEVVLAPPTSDSLAILLASTALVALMSEVLVGGVEEASRALGLSRVFVGVVVVAIIGNAAEHSTAVLMALKNKMDLAVGIAIGSAVQIALLVAPALVFASYLRHEPMDLLFNVFEVLAVLLSVTIARMVAADGESNWLEGAMLLMIYAILAVAFFFMPSAPPKSPHETPQAQRQKTADVRLNDATQRPSRLKLASSRGVPALRTMEAADGLLRPRHVRHGSDLQPDARKAGSHKPGVRRAKELTRPGSRRKTGGGWSPVSCEVATGRFAVARHLGNRF